jgi:hypothetical protein
MKPILAETALGASDGIFIPIKKGQRLEVCEGIIKIDEYRIVEFRLPEEKSLRLAVCEEWFADATDSSGAS